MVDEFREYANSFNHGHLKPWKAIGMISKFPEMVKWGRSRKETASWVKSCLVMEGFRTTDCEKINDWLWENVNG